MQRPVTVRPPAPRERFAALDWEAIRQVLDARGFALVPGLLAPAECRDLAALYPQEHRFRSRVVMGSHGFGSGEYRYFRYPLPPLVRGLRTALYRGLAPLAGEWNRRLGNATSFPSTLAAYTRRCHTAGQTRPTPLLLRYEAGDYNRLHRDLYGELVFPIQATVLLSRPGDDFEGGEFLLVEQRPRMQSRGEVVPLGHGDAVLFTVRDRPVRGRRGYYRAAMRHGVGTVRDGLRMSLGIIFHDAA